MAAAEASELRAQAAAAAAAAEGRARRLGEPGYTFYRCGHQAAPLLPCPASMPCLVADAVSPCTVPHSAGSVSPVGVCVRARVRMWFHASVWLARLRAHGGVVG
jgi:hypothetical protein|eukprot:SAG25_NODE_424_length_8177_cov_219.173310_9_plen_104_part_00